MFGESRVAAREKQLLAKLYGGVAGAECPGGINIHCVLICC